MKILVVAPYFPPSIGGVQNYALNIAKGLKKDYNYKIVVVTSNHEDKTYKEETLKGMKIYRLPYQFKVSNTPISFKWKKQIKEIIEKEKPNVINAHSPVPFISDITARIAHKKRIPFVLTYHTGSMKKGIFYLDWIISIYENLFLKMMLKDSLKIIATSDWISQTILKAQTEKIKIITPAADIKLFSPNNKRHSKNKILFVGSLNKTESYKGVDYLINGLNLMKKDMEFTCDIVGEGDLKEYYKELAKELKLEKQINFLGKLFGKKLVKEYQISSLLVLPSSLDNFPIVLLEAMACKKPIIATNIGGIPEIIDNNKNGLLVPPKDSKALAEAIIKILKNPKLARQMGEEGYKKVKKNFTWGIQSKKMDKIIQEILR